MLTVIIPTLNAEMSLGKTLDSVAAAAQFAVAVVVIDGQSTDQTQTLAQAAGATVIQSDPGRGLQLATGAKAAQGGWLLFLHADTVLPKGWDVEVHRFMADPFNTERAAYFKLGFDEQSKKARRVASIANWRAKALSLPYGDQGLLIHRSLYDLVGGYNANLKLMEDVDLVQRLGPMRIKRLRACVVTSAQKYRTDGWWARPIRNILCLGLFLARAPNRWIESLYK
ncbi:MAG: TIGR04283 family arsenosugar biosynthesis glycosyltransferase [Magnetovibrio sp.]|nr:TIGR04283 family arsenosugar biosynthesis glycosyltransferase [Magnetovibrio sp.]